VLKDHSVLKISTKALSASRIVQKLPNQFVIAESLAITVLYAGFIFRPTQIYNSRAHEFVENTHDNVHAFMRRGKREIE
jgi:hypothetical protein